MSNTDFSREFGLELPLIAGGGNIDTSGAARGHGRTSGIEVIHKLLYGPLSRALNQSKSVTIRDALPAGESIRQM